VTRLYRVYQESQNGLLQEPQFYRQKNIGNYIVDFYRPAASLIIEIDGGQHYSEEGLQRDAVRDDYLEQLGFRVLRFTDTDVLKNMEAVLDIVSDHL